MIIKESDAIDHSCCRDLKQSCVGSRCMAWRWADEEGTDPTTKWPFVIKSTTHGFCGLAGRP